VLTTPLDRAVFANEAGTADSNERRQAHLVLRRTRREVLQHFDEPLDRLVAFGLVIRVTPHLALPDAAFREVCRLFKAELDDASTNVRAADIHRQNAVMPGKYPGRGQLSDSDEAGLI